MKKYRIYKSFTGYDVYYLRDMGRGYAREFLSHHETREAAEHEIEELKKLEEQGYEPIL